VDTWSIQNHVCIQIYSETNHVYWMYNPIQTTPSLRSDLYDATYQHILQAKKLQNIKAKFANWFYLTYFYEEKSD